MARMTETAGKVASKTLDVLKGQPAFLVVIILNLVFIGFMYFATSANRERQAKEFELIMQRCYQPSSQGQ
jgi:hypothetical protein